MAVTPDWFPAFFQGLRLLVLPGVALAAYLLGGFNGAVIVSKYILCDDVRNHGSGNAGLTNFYRTFGGPLAFAVILTDVIKTVLAVLVGAWAFHSAGQEAVLFGKYYAGLFCIIGHMFPWIFRFKGGKGVLSGGTIVAMIDWRIALALWCAFLLLVVLTRYISLGSIFAGAAFPFATWFVFYDPMFTILAFLCGGLIVWGHRTNIRRLLSGKENKFTLHNKRTEDKR